MHSDDPETRAEVLAEQRARVTALASHDERMQVLEARRTDLEVDRIAAEVALRNHPDPRVDAMTPADADAVLFALDRVRDLEKRTKSGAASLASRGQAGEAFARRMAGGIAALDRWLTDAESERTGAGTRIASRVLLVVVAAVLVLAFQVHLAFLVLLVPIGGAASFALWTGGDSEWRQVGAKRHLEKLDIEPPAAWTAESVRAKRAELVVLMDRAAERARGPDDDEDDAAHDPLELQLELVEARVGSEATLRAAGFAPEAVDAGFERRLRQVAALVRAERALAVVTHELHRHAAEAGTIRESVFRTLSKEGAAPADGRADAKTLADGLDSVAADPEPGAKD